MTTMTTTTTASPADYWVGGLIGEGAFGRVVYGKHKGTGRNVAIKVVDKCSVQKRPVLGRAIWKERTLLAQWNDAVPSFTVALWSAFHDDQCLYLVMECCTGGTLSHVISCGLLEDDDDDDDNNRSRRRRWFASIPQYGLQLVSALEFIHSQRIIHADIKPDNVLVTGDAESSSSRLKLADFGSCILMDATSSSSSSTSATTTTTTAPFMTTAAYAPPELLKGLPVSQLTLGVDLWSFGCVLATMFLGKSPFDAPTEALTVQAIAQHAVNDDIRYQLITVSSASEIPVPFQALIHDLLHPSPSSRCQAVMLDETLSQAGRCYDHWKEQGVWKRISAAAPHSSLEGGGEEEDLPLFRAPPPRWWTEVQEEGKDDHQDVKKQQQLQDGAKGWTVYLL